jgi:hypothetical protein
MNRFNGRNYDSRRFGTYGSEKLILFQNVFLFKMIQLINPDELIVGEKYYIKRKPRYLQVQKNSIGIFESHDAEFDGFGTFTILNNEIEFDFDLIEIYRFVTSKEYYIKLKEKYDLKCLDIILKRLVNETFEW